MDSYSNLREYLKAKEKGGFGWGEKYNNEVSPNKNWPHLCGHYQNLLSQALDWIPPALMKEMMNCEADHNRIKAEAVREAVKSCQFVQYGDHKCFSDELMEYADKLERGDT